MHLHSGYDLFLEKFNQAFITVLATTMSPKSTIQYYQTLIIVIYYFNCTKHKGVQLMLLDLSSTFSRISAPT